MIIMKAEDDHVTIQIMIVDDHTLVRDGLSMFINAEKDMRVVASAGNGLEAVDLYEKFRPDITLMDLRMPVMNGVDAIEQICGRYPEAKIIVLTTYYGDEDIFKAIQAGAMSYLLKDVPSQEALEVIRTVYRGKNYLPRNIADRLSQRLKGSSLTEREKQVLEEMAKGMSNMEICAKLNVTENTIKFHIRNIFSKLDAADRSQAIIEGLKRGIIHLE
jgi:two-component system, NarL family, response regulator